MEKKNYTPMMMQYLKVKEQYEDTIILYRLGDFYEMFFEDAKIASRELELVLTGRDAGVEERVPMCGVPHHSVKGYIERLVDRGYKVGIVEQLEDPATAKGIVKRDVVQIVTPGTLIDLGLQERKNNYLLEVEEAGSSFILSYVDLSTGEISVCNIARTYNALKGEIDSLECKEIVVNEDFDADMLLKIKDGNRLTISYQKELADEKEYAYISESVSDYRQVKSINRLVGYLIKTQKRNLDYLKKAIVIEKTELLQIDGYSRNNLELTRTLRSEDRYGSLLWILDKCKTAAGSRMLKRWISNPLCNSKAIDDRLKIVDSFVNNFICRKQVIELLKEVYDLERLVARISYGNANARDLVQLKKSLSVVPEIKTLLKDSGEMDLFVLSDKIKALPEIVDLIEKAIIDNPPLTIKEGGIIKEGYNSDLDELKYISHNGKTFIASIESNEREKTGIKGLKVGYNKVFGYYIEITNSYLSMVKDEFGYIRKQTLTGAERFITNELKEKEDMILKAEEKIVKLEYELFGEIRDKVKDITADIQNLADVLSTVDVLSNFAEVAVTNGYVRPVFNEDDVISLQEVRHPVLEQLVGKENFVKNNVYIDNDKFLQIITGPNMGGKSTIMRQVAIAVIMAQIGSYVACKEASLCLFDKIFTRIGASDDLVSGKSTFMVEMMEANNALRNATNKSLIIFDEIGRGTSTYDGMALAQAIIEYIALNIKAKTLFSTHYHELTFLESKLDGIVNKNVGVYEENDKVTFLYTLQDGCANKSYGVNVARLAHLPDTLLERAKQILISLEKNDNISSMKKEVIIKEVEPEYVKDIKNLDPLNMSPMEALNYLIELKSKII
jgi:DNA mismatch repair protein MutS